MSVISFANETASHYRNCTVVVAGQPESFAPLATTHFSNVIFIVTCIVALISLSFGFYYYCIHELFLNKCE